ncbi:transposase [Roseomonas chloroacetimidivorans]|uniref:transposase n=1 Tax=Roseomonas chloroacetimidivorans TaxID=1766656 RepID=UPI003C733216
MNHVAKELGVQPSILRNWRERLGPASGITASDHPAGAASTLSAEQAEIGRLQKELERAQVKRDIRRPASASSRAGRDEVPLRRSHAAVGPCSIAA